MNNNPSSLFCIQSIWSVGRESFFFNRNTRIYDIFYAEQMAPYSIIVVDSRSARGRQDGRVRYLLRFNSVLPELSAGCWHFEKGLSGTSVVCFQSGASVMCLLFTLNIYISLLDVVVLEK